jgi:hypothetical protein
MCNCLQEFKNKTVHTQESLFCFEWKGILHLCLWASDPTWVNGPPGQITQAIYVNRLVAFPVIWWKQCLAIPSL